ncbi:MAG: hypothetical protein ACLUIQ_06450 [Dialister invisus]
MQSFSAAGGAVRHSADAHGLREAVEPEARAYMEEVIGSWRRFPDLFFKQNVIKSY